MQRAFLASHGAERLAAAASPKSSIPVDRVAAGVLLKYTSSSM
jgi:hypothetical protein